MKVSYEALQLLIFLMPGLLASILLSAFLVREKREAFVVIVESLVLSFVIYAIASPFVHEVPVRLEPISTSGAVVSYRLVWLTCPLLVTLGLSILVPTVVAFSANRDLHMRLLRAIGATRLKAGGNTWFEVFSDKPRYVVVKFSDGSRIFGWPEYSSRDADEGLVYVQDPAWIRADNSYDDLGVDGILLTKKDNIEYIIFTEISEENVKEREADRPTEQEKSTDVERQFQESESRKTTHDSR